MQHLFNGYFNDGNYEIINKFKLIKKSKLVESKH